MHDHGRLLRCCNTYIVLIMSEGDNKEIIYFISIGMISTLAAFQIIEHALAGICSIISKLINIRTIKNSSSADASGIHILWRILAIITVLIVISHNLYNYLLDQAKDTAKEVKENWREILGWIWCKIQENWHPLTQMCWNFVKENIVPFFNQVVQYLRENFKPALQKFGRFVAIKCRALTGYAEQLFSRVSQYL